MSNLANTLIETDAKTKHCPYIGKNCLGSECLMWAAHTKTEEKRSPKRPQGKGWRVIPDPHEKHRYDDWWEPKYYYGRAVQCKNRQEFIDAEMRHWEPKEPFFNPPRRIREEKEARERLGREWDQMVEERKKHRERISREADEAARKYAENPIWQRQVPSGTGHCEMIERDERASRAAPASRRQYQNPYGGHRHSVTQFDDGLATAGIAAVAGFAAGSAFDGGD